MNYIALLRGINVGGHRKVPMNALREPLEQEGLIDIKTYIQSGNIVFSIPENKRSDLQARIENRLRITFGFEIPVLLFTRAAFEGILDQNPFINMPSVVEKQLYFVFLRNPVSDSQGITAQQTRNIPELKLLKNALNERDFPGEDWALGPNCVYLNCRSGYGKAKLNNNLVERLGNLLATTRNLKTVQWLNSAAQ